jgi:uncharacterized hydrophobic protein (TIGR00271 family)
MASEPAAGTDPGLRGVLGGWHDLWRREVVDTVDQASVIAERREECALTGRYLFMLAMSAAIAILGLLLSSPAVVIGAMLLSPLMGPIIGLGFALAIGDFGWMRQASRTLAIGTAMGVLLCALMVMLSPLQTVTSEIAARTKPNLFDLLVALFSALAGSYAMIRGREGFIVGVAIAIALMPPLAVIGFGIATLNWTVFSGSLMLFITNLTTIALVAAVMARLYGFRTSLSAKQTHFQTGLIVVVFVVLAVPLGYSLRQIAWESNATRLINAAVLDTFDSRARLSQIAVNYDTQPIQVAATVLTPQVRPNAERITARAVSRQIGAPVDVTITQYLVGTSASAAEEAQLAAARAREVAELERAEELAVRLTVIAGVPNGDVLVDRERRRAQVTARPLEGATLAAYRELERRIAATEPEWRIALRPPARPLPDVAVADGEPTEEGREKLALAVWAARRVGLPVLVSGPAEAADNVAARFAEQGIEAEVVPGRSANGEVTLRWGSVEE